MRLRGSNKIGKLAALAIFALAGSTISAQPSSEASAPYPSTYQPRASAPVLIRGATILDGRGRQIEGSDVLMAEGRIAAIGPGLTPPAGATVIDGAGKWVTPGIIDVHSHIGAGPSPEGYATESVGEFTGPVTPEVMIEHGIVVQDPAFSRAAAGGVTTLQILPGSGNLFGGRTVVLKNVPARTVQEMKFPGAPYGLKMACGEIPTMSYNPANHQYGTRGETPATRMGNFSVYRATWTRAREYAARWRRYEASAERGVRDLEPPERDLELETLAGVLDGEIRVHMHCHRADEMALVLDLAREFDYRIGTFHHALEAYKIADLLAGAGVCTATWSDWWGYNMESYDGIRENLALVHAAGGCAMIHSDHAVGLQHLNQEVAKARASAARRGLEISRADAWQWLSYNPARALGIEERTGSLEPGKMADLVLWDGDPFSIYTRAEKVFVDGALTFDRLDPSRRWVSDVELGQTGEGDRK